MKTQIFSLLVGAALLSACGPQMAKPGEVVLGEGKIKVINEQRLLIQEQRSVVALDYDKTSGSYLSGIYKAGQGVKLLGTKTVDKNGNSSEKIKAIIFEDGRRFNING